MHHTPDFFFHRWRFACAAVLLATAPAWAANPSAPVPAAAASTTAADAAARAPGATAPQATERLQTINRQLLPEAERALTRHLRHCNTQRAVLQVRQAMASSEPELGGARPDALWHDLETLTAQCEVQARGLRAAIEQHQAERAQLQAPPPQTAP